MDSKEGGKEGEGVEEQGAEPCLPPGQPGPCTFPSAPEGGGERGAEPCLPPPAVPPALEPRACGAAALWACGRAAARAMHCSGSYCKILM